MAPDRTLHWCQLTNCRGSDVAGNGIVHDVPDFDCCQASDTRTVGSRSAAPPSAEGTRPVQWQQRA